MKPVYYVSNEKPRSHNKAGSNQSYKERHSNRFKDRYAHLYSGLPTAEKPLKSRLTYIYSNLRPGNIPDVDNLSKPIIDAFTGVIYVDDKQIISRRVERISLDQYQFVTIEFSDMPKAIIDDFETFINDQEDHILLYGVDNIGVYDIRIGEI